MTEETLSAKLSQFIKKTLPEDEASDQDIVTYITLLGQQNIKS